MVQTAVATKSVGAEMAAVLPNDGVPWYKKGHLIRLNVCLLSLILFSSNSGYDGSLMNGLQTLPLWQEFMGTPSGAWLGFINAAMSLGCVINFPLLAWACDKYGRKKIVWVGYFYLILGTVLQTAATGPAMFVVARLMYGGCLSWFGQAAPLLITETAFPTQRGVLTALYNTQWYSGSIIAAWVCFGTRNYTTSWCWRLPSVLQALLPCAAFVGYWYCPESPRWLVSVGRIDEAREILITYHAGGDRDSALVDFEMREIQQTIAAEQAAAAGGSYLDLFRGKGNRHRSLISLSLGIACQWAGNGVASYYLAKVLETVGITSVTNQNLINGCLQIWNLIMAVGAALLVDKVGRRPLFLCSAAGMFVSYVCISGLSGSFATSHVAATGIAVIPMLFLFYASYDIALTPLIISYTAEIWPFSNRARGLVLVQCSTYIAIFFNIFINPIALEAIAWKYYLVFVVILIGIFFIFYFYYPETRGRSLEEIAAIFDGEDAVAERTHSILETVEKRHSITEIREVPEKS